MSKLILLVGANDFIRSNYGKAMFSYFAHVSPRKFKTPADEQKHLGELRNRGANVLIDFKNLSVSDRKYYVSIFKNCNIRYTIECHDLAEDIDYDYGMSLEDNETEKAYDEPTLLEGFTKIVKVDASLYYPKLYCNKAIFFELESIVGFTKSREKSWIPNSLVNDTLEFYHESNYLLFAISNHASLGLPESSLHDKIVKALEDFTVPIKDVFYCPHTLESKCSCRKPLPGMAFEAKTKYKLNLPKSTMVGFEVPDKEFAINSDIGCFTTAENFCKVRAVDPEDRYFMSNKLRSDV